LDRVLGGGLVPGSVTLVGGEPGVGKSTLLLQVAAAVASSGATTLYVTAEESAAQVRDRAQRLGGLDDRLLLAAETSVPAIVAQIVAARPALVVVDSIQTVHDPGLAAAPGSVTQVRAAAHALVEVAKTTGVAVLVVGHVTKDGSLAGPRALEHVVDTVVSFEGDRHHDLRLVRAVKHRFGSTQELGLFALTAAGLVAVADPSGAFLADRRPGESGSVVFPAMEGRRPLLVEVQALVTTCGGEHPRRTLRGLDAGRVALILAVLDRRLGLPILRQDVYASVVGGTTVIEPAADLAVAVSVASSLVDRAVAADLVVLGEVGLAGEVRSVGGVERRLLEAARLGFTRAVVPPGTDIDVPDLRVEPVATVADALVRSGLAGAVAAA
jgi:DNA repair protein RadA/Sms